MGDDSTTEALGLSPSKTRPVAADAVDNELIWALVDAAPDALIVINDCGLIELVNGQTEDMFGYERGDLFGRPVEILIPLGAKSVHQAHRARYRNDPIPRPMGAGMSLRGRRADGSEFPVEISLSPFTAADGQRIVAAVRDVTNRLEAERHSRAIRHAIDTAVDGIFIADDTSLVFTYVNQQGADMHGYRVDEILGMTLYQLAPALHQGKLGQSLVPLMAGEVGAVTHQSVALRKDGAEFPVEIHINHPPVSYGGTDRPIVAIVQDITARVKTEHELADSRAETELVEERERVARDLHDRVIGDLFGLGLCLQGLVGQVAEDRPAQGLQDAVATIDHIIGLVRATIFDLKNPPDTATDVEERLRGLINTLQERLSHQPSVTVTGLADEVPDHLVDELLVVTQEALNNIARHAQATTTDITLDIGSAQLVLVVTDNGLGLPTGGSQRPGGLGINNLCSRAETLGGHCTIESNPTGGVSLTWEVPST